MSNLETHEAEQAAITALCEAGLCDHPECHEDDMDDEDQPWPVALAVYDPVAGEGRLVLEPEYEAANFSQSDVPALDCLQDIMVQAKNAYYAAHRVVFPGVLDDEEAHVELEDRRAVATILAALRKWQRDMTNSVNLASMSDIATDGGKLDPLTAAEIDDLCERINTEA